jgi:hypothetical protein
MRKTTRYQSGLECCLYVSLPARWCLIRACRRGSKFRSQCDGLASAEEHEADGRATAATRRFSGSGVDLLSVYEREDLSTNFRDQ